MLTYLWIPPPTTVEPCLSQHNIPSAEALSLFPMAGSFVKHTRVLLQHAQENSSSLRLPCLLEGISCKKTDAEELLQVIEPGGSDEV